MLWSVGHLLREGIMVFQQHGKLGLLLPGDIKKLTLIQDYPEGGMRAPDVEPFAYIFLCSGCKPR